MTGDLFHLVIGSFHQHIRLNEPDQVLGRFFVKEDHSVNKRERSQSYRSGMFVIERAVVAFQCCHGRIGIQSDDQDIAQVGCFRQVLDMSEMQDIETAIGKDDLLFFEAPDIRLTDDPFAGIDFRLNDLKLFHWIFY